MDRRCSGGTEIERSSLIRKREGELASGCGEDHTGVTLGQANLEENPDCSGRCDVLSIYRAPDRARFVVSKFRHGIPFLFLEADHGSRPPPTKQHIEIGIFG